LIFLIVTVEVELKNNGDFIILNLLLFKVRVSF